MRFQQLYLDNLSQVELVHKLWQNFDPTETSLKIAGKDHCGIVGQVDLDPQEQSLARKLFNTISKDYTVFLIFGRPQLLYKHWAPIFDKHFSSKVECRSSLFNVIRSS